jgi:uncharacterized protein YegJ (DUF2314 family)
MSPKVRIVVIIAAVIVGIISAQQKQKKRQDRERYAREHNLVHPGDDPRFKAAEAEAIRRFPEFVAAFNRKAPGDVFIVKSKFVQGEDAEFMWVQVASIAGNRLTGVLKDTPVMVTNVKEGQTLTVNQSDVDDWAYKTANGQLTGGFTDKILEQIQKEQR